MKLKERIKKTIHNLITLQDTTHHISFGFALGVFCGIIPGTGPVASLFCAMLLKTNKTSALLGSILTNTWMSIVFFTGAVKIGSFVSGITFQTLRGEWNSLIADFHFSSLFKLSFMKLLLPVLSGYLILSFLAGVLAYIFCFILIHFLKTKNKTVSSGANGRQ